MIEPTNFIDITRKAFETSNKLIKTTYHNIAVFGNPVLHPLFNSQTHLEYYRKFYSDTGKGTILSKPLMEVLQRRLIASNRGLFSMAKESKNTDVDVIVLSHAFDKTSFKERDFYFSEHIKAIEDAGITFKVCYIDHSVHTDLREKVLLTPHILLSKTLGILPEIVLLLMCYVAHIIHIVVLMYSKETRASIRFAVKLVTRGGPLYALSSLRLYLQMRLLLRVVRCKVLITSHEGYPWERIVIRACNDAKFKISTFLYQNGIVSKYSQSLFKSFDDSRYNPSAFLAATPQHALAPDERSKFYGSENSTILVVGSSKHAAFAKERNTANFSRTMLLLLPQGELGEYTTFVDFIEQSQAYYGTSFDVTIRFHPGFPLCPELSRRLDKVLQMNNAVRISRSTLEDDIRCSTHVIFMRSSSAVQATSAGLYPLAIKNEHLPGHALTSTTCGNVPELSVGCTETEFRYAINAARKVKVHDTVTYFSPFDSRKLISILNQAIL